MTEKTSGEEWELLPSNARLYLERIQELVEIPSTLFPPVPNGPTRLSELILILNK